MMQRLRHSSNVQLGLLVVLADAAIVFGGLPLEDYALRSAFDPSSTAALILALLAANIALLAIVAVAIASSSLLLYRLVRYAKFR